MVGKLCSRAAAIERNTQTHSLSLSLSLSLSHTHTHTHTDTYFDSGRGTFIRKSSSHREERPPLLPPPFSPSTPERQIHRIPVGQHEAFRNEPRMPYYYYSCYQYTCGLQLWAKNALAPTKPRPRLRENATFMNPFQFLSKSQKKKKDRGTLRPI